MRSICYVLICFACAPCYSSNSTTMFEAGKPPNHAVLEYNTGEKKYPYCKKCHGCKHELKTIDSAVEAFNKTFVHRNGWSRAWVFKTASPSLECGRSEASPIPASESTPSGMIPITPCLLFGVQKWGAEMKRLFACMRTMYVVPKTSSCTLFGRNTHYPSGA